jgi:hypothetical protein
VRIWHAVLCVTHVFTRRPCPIRELEAAQVAQMPVPSVPAPFTWPVLAVQAPLAVVPTVPLGTTTTLTGHAAASSSSYRASTPSAPSQRMSTTADSLCAVDSLLQLKESPVRRRRGTTGVCVSDTVMVVTYQHPVELERVGACDRGREW